MHSLLEMIATCTEGGNADRDMPCPPDLKGQDGADALTAKAPGDGLNPNCVVNEGLMPGIVDAGILGQNWGGLRFQRSAVSPGISVRRV